MPDIFPSEATTRLPKIVVGVWKDKLTPTRSLSMAQDLATFVNELGDIPFVPAVAPAPISVLSVRDAAADSGLVTVNQDVHWPADSGSFVGTTSLAMLKDAGIEYSMVGHSERRRFFGETDDQISLKVGGLLREGITPILCVGDEETDLRARRAVLKTQLEVGLRSPDGFFDISKIVIAYEPVWAISTWRTDTPLPSGDDVVTMLDLVREIVEQATGQDIHASRFLFGGSVNSTTAPEYFGRAGVDGALVGGASLQFDSLTAIYSSAAAAWSE